MPITVMVREGNEGPWSFHGCFRTGKAADKASCKARAWLGYRTHKFQTCKHVITEAGSCKKCKEPVEECECVWDGSPERGCTKCGECGFVVATVQGGKV